MESSLAASLIASLEETEYSRPSIAQQQIQHRIDELRFLLHAVQPQTCRNQLQQQKQQQSLKQRIGDFKHECLMMLQKLQYDLIQQQAIDFMIQKESRQQWLEQQQKQEPKLRKRQQQEQKKRKQQQQQQSTSEFCTCPVFVGFSLCAYCGKQKSSGNSEKAIVIDDVSGVVQRLLPPPENQESSSIFQDFDDAAFQSFLATSDDNKDSTTIKQQQPNIKNNDSIAIDQQQPTTTENNDSFLSDTNNISTVNSHPPDILSTVASVPLTNIKSSSPGMNLSDDMSNYSNSNDLTKRNSEVLNQDESKSHIEIVENFEPRDMVTGTKRKRKSGCDIEHTNGTLHFKSLPRKLTIDRQVLEKLRTIRPVVILQRL